MNQKESLISHMVGTWKFEDENDSILLIISQTLVQLDINGQQEEFAQNGHWLDTNHFGFWNNYFITDATDNTLVFGKHNVPMIMGNYEWVKTFTRIS